MSEKQFVHRFGDVVAVRYGNKDGFWDEGAPARVAQFVLGHDVDTRLTTLTERMLDVVHPVEQFWDPKRGVADLEIIDPQSRTSIGLGLGQWLGRFPDGRLRPMSHNQITGYDPNHNPTRVFEKDLCSIINYHARDAQSDTPDFILAKYMLDCLTSFNRAMKARSDWYGPIRSEL